MSVASMKKAAMAGGAALVIGSSALGIAAAQTVPPGPPPTAPGSQTPQRPGMSAFVDALARQLGITTDRLQQATSAARSEVGMSFQRGQGQRPGGAEARGHRRGGGPGEAAAQAIGISPEQLRQEIQGKSLADVAQAHGKNPADVAAALKSAANQRIDQMMTHVVEPRGSRPQS
jgi:hypothetical protein